MPGDIMLRGYCTRCAMTVYQTMQECEHIPAEIECFTCGEVVEVEWDYVGATVTPKLRVFRYEVLPRWIVQPKKKGERVNRTMALRVGV